MHCAGSLQFAEGSSFGWCDRCRWEAKSRAIAASLDPQFLRNGERLDLLLCPPGGLIAAPVERAMMQSAQRHGELVAHPAPERRGLSKPEMMGIRRSPTAEQARLQCYELEVIAVAVAPRFAQGQVGFVDPGSARVRPGGLLAIRYSERQGSVERQSAGVRFSRLPAFA